MDLTTLLTFLAAVCTATAYTFHETVILNSVLESNLQHAKRLHAREVRDAEHTDHDNCEHNHSHHLVCCGNTAPLTDDAKDLDDFIDCFNNTPNGSAQVHLNLRDKDLLSYESILLSRKEQIVCIVECMAKKKNVVDDEGNPNEEAMKLQIQQQFTEDWKQELAGQAVKKCIADWKAQTAAANPGECNLAAIKLIRCFWIKIELNCPSEHQINSKLCNFIRDEVERMYNED